MAIEIERKFLVVHTQWKDRASGLVYSQGYLPTRDDSSVRVRIAGDKAYLTIKGKAKGLARAEFEYEIPVSDAETLLSDFCEKPLIEKTRYKVEIDNHTWDVDEFHGENKGLFLAEVELSHENETFSKPDWLGEEVSHDIKYLNANLIKNPYKFWKN